MNTDVDFPSIIVEPIATFPVLEPGRDAFVTRRQAAQILQLDEATLRNWPPERLARYKVGDRVRYRLSDVLTVAKREG